MESDSYRKISLIYNDLVRHVDYAGWAKYLNGIISHYGIRTDRVLELASGTGKLFPRLRIGPERGIMSDISFNMLDQASAKYPKICCDMTMIPFKKEFDLVISCFDSVNHLPNLLEVGVHFREVASILKPSGFFLFDVVTEENSKAYLATYSKSRTTGGIKYSQASDYDETTHTHFNRFIITESGKEPITQENREYIYTETELETVLMASGLEVMNKYDAFSFDPVEEDTYRIQYITRKKNDT